MATCIHSSRSCLLPFYTIPIFPLLNRMIFHLLVKINFADIWLVFAYTVTYGFTFVGPVSMETLLTFEPAVFVKITQILTSPTSIRYIFLEAIYM